MLRTGEDFASLAGRVCAVLGWTPDAFWAATPAEIAGILRALSGDEAAPVGRDAVAALMEAFPDG
jgi:uncharacterized phage protein (TIGR02216 family)